MTPASSFVAFGKGDIDLPNVIEAATDSGFNSWVVVEQDVLNGGDLSIPTFQKQCVHDQELDRETKQ
jgi:inosose dehydratase